jgi:hypothetical protein
VADARETGSRAYLRVVTRCSVESPALGALVRAKQEAGGRCKRDSY